MFYLNDAKEDLKKFLLTKGEPSWLWRKIIFASIHGSHAYGLNIDSSDVDVTGICSVPSEYYYGFLNSFDQKQLNKPDGQIYGILKFFKLATDNNPNVMELLWIDPQFWVITTKMHIDLVTNRHLFLSAKCRYTYSGYAMAQLKRIKTHKRWLLQPVTHKPTRPEFGLPEARIISRDQQGALNALAKEEEIDIAPNFIEYLQKENAYNRAMQEWEQYNNWKATRNPVRAEMEAKFGYDTKHGMHLVRLMRQCREILETGTLNVFRKDDRDELLAIRDGDWSYDKLIEWADTQDKEMDVLYENTLLPKEPRRKEINNLCIKLVEESF
jgi:predicted nucleotidyltransferase